MFKLIQNLGKISQRVFQLNNSKLGLLDQNKIDNQQLDQNLIYKSCYDFTKWSRPEKKKKNKERKSAMAVSDEKAAKIADISQKKAVDIKLDTRPPIATQDQVYEKKKSPEEIVKLKEEQIYKTEGRRVKLPIQLQKQNPLETLPKDQNGQIIFPTPNEFVKKDSVQFTNKVEHIYANVEDIINEKFQNQIKKVESPSLNSKRIGVIGYKVGMTHTWDQWGTFIPLSVIHLDRVQVTQVKQHPQDSNKLQIQIGLGQKNLKRLKKPQIGHFMKANVPPKHVLREFTVTKENSLPEGFMISVRHFTVGQCVDVQGLSCGKGFTGVMKRWNFRGGPASHGCSLSHRQLGSTGQRQDPGRVFKNKKMSGRMGTEMTTVQNLKVYKIDAERSLIFVKGNVPGKEGTVVKVKDASKKIEFNYFNNYLNFPTFIPDKTRKLATQMVMEPPLIDVNEKFIHENDVLE